MESLFERIDEVENFVLTEGVDTELVEDNNAEVINKVKSYIIDDFHRMEDFTDTEVTENTLDSVHAIIDRVLSKMPAEELNKMSREIDSDTIDLTRYAHYCWEIAESEESDRKFTPEQEAAIKRLMKKLNISREEVIKLADSFKKLTGN